MQGSGPGSGAAGERFHGEAGSQAALEILRTVSSLWEVSRLRAAFGRVCQSCQGWDKDLPQWVPSIPACTKGIGAAWKSRSCPE